MEEIEYLFSKNMQYIGIAGLCVAVIQVSCLSLPVLGFMCGSYTGKLSIFTCAGVWVLFINSFCIHLDSSWIHFAYIKYLI